MFKGVSRKHTASELVYLATAEYCGTAYLTAFTTAAIYGQKPQLPRGCRARDSETAELLTTSHQPVPDTLRSSSWRLNQTPPTSSTPGRPSPPRPAQPVPYLPIRPTRRRWPPPPPPCLGGRPPGSTGDHSEAPPAPLPLGRSGFQEGTRGQARPGVI